MLILLFVVCQRFDQRDFILARHVSVVCLGQMRVDCHVQLVVRAIRNLFPPKAAVLFFYADIGFSVALTFRRLISARQTARLGVDRLCFFLRLAAS